MGSMEAARVTMPVPDDKQFLGELYASHAERVYGFVLSRCGSRALAEDLTGDTFVDAARAVARGDRDRIDRSWLITVARRRVVDHWRRASNYERKLDGLRGRQLGEGVDLRDGLDDDHDQVIAALDSLPTRQRACLALRYLEGYSLSEVADVLGIGYRAAESLVARARQSFVDAYNAGEGA